MAANEKPAAAGDGARAGIGSAVRRIAIEDISEARAPQRATGSNHPKARWRRAALRAMRGKARPCALVAVLPVAFDDSLRTRASNEWLMHESSLDRRSVIYALGDLAEAGLINVEIRGPKRIITAVPPTIPDDVKGEQVVHPMNAVQSEQFGRKARTSCAPIGGRRLPLPPQAKTSQLSTTATAAARERVFTILGSGSVQAGREIAATLDRSLVQRWLNAEQLGALDEPMVMDIEAARLAAPSSLSRVEGSDRIDMPADAAKVVLSLLGQGSIVRGRELAAAIEPALIAFWTASVRGGLISDEAHMSLKQHARRARLDLAQSTQARAAS